MVPFFDELAAKVDVALNGKRMVDVVFGVLRSRLWRLLAPVKSRLELNIEPLYLVAFRGASVVSGSFAVWDVVVAEDETGRASFDKPLRM
jgi:hypothetical protein